ncbi:leukocyte elastase inhibitor-like [Danaus plexippus]|uniref:leukocyte elastase inhibitor-like n=1 Tax=Danaus plexippus TaxID=13037 RepID=UPI002AB2A31E|nr:leukocyte elastase inhibitor-like [Danaus plexippus]
MLKIVLIVFWLSSNHCGGVAVNDLRDFGEKVRNLSLDLLYFTEIQNEGQIAMAPFTVWKLFSIFAFESSGESWTDIHSIIGIPKREGLYFNKLFNYVTNLLLQISPGRMLRSRQVVFYDSNLKLSRHFQRNIRNSGALMKKINFNDNVMAAKLANDYIQLTNYSFLAKKIVFHETDFKKTSMIVSGVVEFSGAWSLPFHEINTVLEDGHKGNGKVYMMHQWANVRYADIEQLGASVLELPYGEDKEYSMIIMRPEGDLSVTDVLENLAKIDFLEVIHRLYSEGLQEIEVKLPKFSLTSSLLLNGPLNAMEMSSIFLRDRANIFKYSKSNMYISAVEHRTEVMVAEAGTVATASIPGNLTKDTETYGLGTAKPFLFFVLHGPSMSIIFCGKYGA